MIFILRKNMRLTWGFVLLFLVQLYINSVRRDLYGVGFGMRRFLNLTPAFALGLMAFFNLFCERKRSALRKMVMAAGVVLVGWNLLLMAQYYLSKLGSPLIVIGPPGSEPGPAWVAMMPREMMVAQFTEAPRLLWQLVKSGLIFKGLTGHWAMLAPGILALGMTLGFIRWGLPVLEKLPGRIFRHPLILAGIALILITGLNGWLMIADATAKDIHAVDLRWGRTFGQLKHHRLNPDTGYQGLPGGIRLGPDRQACVLEARADHTPQKFLALGTMTISPRKPCTDTGEWTFEFTQPQPADSLILISRIAGDPQTSGSLIGEIIIHTTTGDNLVLPARIGMEISSKYSSIIPKNVQLLNRQFPAVNRIINGEISDTRVEIPLPGTPSVSGITLRLTLPEVIWEIHGLALGID